MIVFRRRLIFWLIKAYIKKSGRTMILSFFLGLLLFFGFAFLSQYVNKLVPLHRTVNVGLVGTYTPDTLPPVVINKISEGLTAVSPNGKILPGIAKNWQVLDGGKTYKFFLRHDITFSNGTPITSDRILYNFTDVHVERPDKYTIIYKLKDAYAPFLVTVSSPVFDNRFNGIGPYEIVDIKENGNFVQTL